MATKKKITKKKKATAKVKTAVVKAAAQTDSTVADTDAPDQVVERDPKEFMSPAQIEAAARGYSYVAVHPITISKEDCRHPGQLVPEAFLWSHNVRTSHEKRGLIQRIAKDTPEYRAAVVASEETHVEVPQAKIINNTIIKNDPALAIHKTKMRQKGIHKSLTPRKSDVDATT